MITIRQDISICDIIERILAVVYAAVPPDNYKKQVLIQTRNLAMQDEGFKRNVETRVQETFSITPDLYDIKELFEDPTAKFSEFLEYTGVLRNAERFSSKNGRLCDDSVAEFNLCADIVSDNGTKELFRITHFSGNLAKAAKYMTERVLQELGDGDGENGGKGSLENCYGDIFNVFMGSGRYCYADCVFTIVPLRKHLTSGR